MIEKLNMQLDSTLMFFPSYTHVFAASCSHKDSTPKIQEARVTAFFFFFFCWEILDFIQKIENQIHHVHTHVPLDWDIPPARQLHSQHIGHAELTSGQGHSPAF